MKYYQAIFNSDPKITGLRNGGYQVEIDEAGFKNQEDYERIKSFFMSLNFWKRENRIPDFEVIIERAKLLPKAKLVDFFWYANYMFGCPFVVSSKAIELFEEYNLPIHYYYPVNLFLKKEIIAGYKLIYIPYLDFDSIDFKNSLFYSGYEISNNIQYFRFKSLEEWQNHDGPLLRPKEIVLNKDVNRSFDLLNLRIGGVFVSEQLKDAIQAGQLIGLNFLDTVNLT